MNDHDVFEATVELARNHYREELAVAGDDWAGRECALRAAVGAVMLAMVPDGQCVVSEDDVAEALVWLEALKTRIMGSEAADEVAALIDRWEPIVRRALSA